LSAITIGSVSITPVQELAGWRFPATNLYPSITPAAFGAAARNWGTRLADPATGELMLDINCYVVRTPDSTILVDTGNGNDKHRPVMAAHHMFATDFLGRLAAVGVKPTDVDAVVSTHLHQDHCGWDTMLVDGEWVPTFSRATHWFSKAELDHVSRFGRTSPDGSLEYDFYRTFEDTIQPVLLAGLARTLTAEHVLFDDGRTRIWVEEVAGHTPGHVIVHVRGEDGYAIMSGDAIHHPLQFADLDLPQVGDVDPAAAARVRRRLVETCIEHDVMLLTAHFPAAGRIVSTVDGYGFAWLAA